jgi:hypothetical protein
MCVRTHKCSNSKGTVERLPKKLLHFFDVCICGNIEYENGKPGGIDDTTVQNGSISNSAFFVPFVLLQITVYLWQH